MISIMILCHSGDPQIAIQRAITHQHVDVVLMGWRPLPRRGLHLIKTTSAHARALHTIGGSLTSPPHKNYGALRPPHFSKMGWSRYLNYGGGVTLIK